MENKLAENYLIIRQARLASLHDILDYIKINNSEKSFFDKNGNKDIYEKFKEDENLRLFHSTLHYFIAIHLPIKRKQLNKEIKQESNPASCLKQKKYDLNI